MAKRGQLTKAVQAKANELMGRDITQVELRLIPYIHYATINARYVDHRKLNDGERTLLEKWGDEGRLQIVGDTIVHAAKEFFDTMGELMWLAYADYQNQPED